MRKEDEKSAADRHGGAVRDSAPPHFEGTVRRGI